MFWYVCLAQLCFIFVNRFHSFCLEHEIRRNGVLSIPEMLFCFCLFKLEQVSRCLVRKRERVHPVFPQACASDRESQLECYEPAIMSANDIRGLMANMQARGLARVI